MKTNCWLILGTMLATSALAQVNTGQPNTPPAPAPSVAAPAPAPVAPVLEPTDTKTNAPAKKSVKAKKKAVKKAKPAGKPGEKSAEKSAALAEKKAAEASLAAPLVPLVPGPATVEADHVNLRGQAGLQGEVVGHAKKGDTVTVLAEINLDKPKAGEPAQWAKIALPTSENVWVNSKYVDAASKAVSAKKLNLRGGPGENYSVLGVIEKGTVVTSVTSKGDWMQIETPTNAFAFVSASYLKQETPGASSAQPAVVAAEAPLPPPAMTPPPPPPTPMPVAEPPAIAPPAATPPPPPPTITSVVPPQPEPTSTLGLPTPTPTLAPDDNDTNLPPPPPRVVTHEGSVRHAVSFVAPTYFELYDPANDKAINYLYTTSTNLNLARYDGLHITVTGEESMDSRWKDTPVLTVQKIYVIGPSPDTIRKPAPRIGRPR